MPENIIYPNEIRLNDREQIQYLLGNPPSWMMRYGISAIAGVFALLLSLSYFIHYPDTIEGKVSLTTTHPPIRVLSKSAGRVVELLVKDKQLVAQGQVLAVLENTADWRDVLRLESWLQLREAVLPAPPSGLHLGELQDAYSTVNQHWKDLDYFSMHNGAAERIVNLRQQIAQLQAINANFDKQKSILDEEFALAGMERQRQKQLHSTRVISDKDYEKTEADYLQKKRQVESSDAATLQNQMQIKQLESQIDELALVKSDRQYDKELTLAEDRQRLTSAVAAWKQQYIISASIQGKVSFSKVWSEQQSIAAGEEILAIVPAGNDPERTSGGQTPILGRAVLPVANSGMLRTGQRAIIRLDGYPARQFGTLETSVGNISLLPQNEGYSLDLYLPDSLQTSYGKIIPFRQEMSGQVRIITENRRVFDRIFDQLRNLLQNR